MAKEGLEWFPDKTHWKSPKPLNKKLGARQNIQMKNIRYLAVSLLILFILPTLSIVFGEETKEYVNRRAEIWNLFFRMTTAAFVVGAVVSGTLIWLVWRFRESHPKNKNPTKWETEEYH